MNLVKKILFAGLIGLFSIAGTTHVCAMDAPASDETKMADVDGILSDFRTILLGRLSASVKKNAFDKYFIIEEVNPEDRTAYEVYCTALVKLLLAEECSQENIQKLFDATLVVFTQFFWKSGSVTEFNRSDVKAKILEQLTDTKKPVSQTLGSFLDVERFSTFCKADEGALASGYKQLSGEHLQDLRQLFGNTELQRALEKLKADLVTMLNTRPASPTPEAKKAQPSFGDRFVKRFRQGVYLLTPGLVYSCVMIAGYAFDMPHRPIPYVPVLKDAVYIQGLWEAGKLGWNVVKQYYSKKKS